MDQGALWDQFLLFVAVGFAAQMIDGAIGMAYGITSTTVLLSVGVSPATASACVHAAETVTTGASGLAHWRLANVDRGLVLRLAVPGMVGGALGAYGLSHASGEALRPFINLYLLVLGLIILLKALRRAPKVHVPRARIAPLGFCGGLLDAIGGGGWGAIVSSTLIGNGMSARYAIGSVNVAEFFVTATISAMFMATIGMALWPIALALIVGGTLAAPFAAYATRHVPDRALMCLVGTVIVLLSLRGLIMAMR